MYVNYRLMSCQFCKMQDQKKWFYLFQIMTTVDPKALREVERLIEDIVDFDGSTLEARFIVKRGVDEEVSQSLIAIWQL
jgi:hypothetical protein